MGQHTWFVKDKTIYDTITNLYKKLDEDPYLDEQDKNQINCEIDKLEDENDTEYHDLFRTNKRNLDGTHINEVIISKEDCFVWLDHPENKVTFRNSIFDTEKDIKSNKKYAYIKLNEFWEKYPNGLIYFT